VLSINHYASGQFVAFDGYPTTWETVSISDDLIGVLTAYLLPRFRVCGTLLTDAALRWPDAAREFVEDAESGRMMAIDCVARSVAAGELVVRRASAMAWALVRSGGHKSERQRSPVVLLGQSELVHAFMAELATVTAVRAAVPDDLGIFVSGHVW